VRPRAGNLAHPHRADRLRTDKIARGPSTHLRRAVRVRGMLSDISPFIRTFFRARGGARATGSLIGCPFWGYSTRKYTQRRPPAPSIPQAGIYTGACGRTALRPNLACMRSRRLRRAPALGIRARPSDGLAATTEPFSSRVCLADLQNVDGLGQLPGTPGAAAQLAGDPPVLELGVRPFPGEFRVCPIGVLL
jgi:hypothetical protein